MANPTVSRAFEPLHKGHAIDQVTMAVTFDREVGDDVLRAAKDLIGKPEELPGRVDLRGVSFQIGGNLLSHPVPTAVAGYAFNKFQADGLLEAELTIVRSAIAYRTLLYTRWPNVWGQAKHYLDAVLPTYVQSGAKLTQVTLNYVDKFVSSAAVEECRPAEILRKDSPFLSSHIFRSNDLWHSHSGRFERRNETTKRLLSVNVDFISEALQSGDRRAVVVTTAIADLFNQATYAPFEVAANDAARSIDVCFQGLHAEDKEVLRSIISDDMIKRIALDS